MRRGFTLLTLALVLFVGAPARATDTIKVLVPDNGNLQYASFWIAESAGFFREEGIAIELVLPQILSDPAPYEGPCGLTCWASSSRPLHSLVVGRRCRKSR